MLPDSRGPLSTSLPSHAMPKLVMRCPCRCQQHTGHCFCCKILHASVIKVTVVHQQSDRINDGWLISGFSTRVNNSKHTCITSIFMFNFRDQPYLRDMKIFYTKFSTWIFLKLQTYSSLDDLTKKLLANWQAWEQYTHAWINAAVLWSHIVCHLCMYGVVDWHIFFIQTAARYKQGSLNV